MKFSAVFVDNVATSHVYHKQHLKETQQIDETMVDSRANKNEAEAQLQIIKSNNADINTNYEVVYGKFYSEGAENGSFAEFPEPKNNE